MLKYFNAKFNVITYDLLKFAMPDLGSSAKKGGAHS